MRYLDTCILQRMLRRQFCYSCHNPRTDRPSHTPYGPGNEPNGHVCSLSSLITITVLALMCAHIVEITVWTGSWEAQQRHIFRIRIRELYGTRIWRCLAGGWH
jgi:hypothetical protein